ncbi:MAG: sensor histidine kinase [Lachnospiraceae bacterium]|jgi:two-component system sensor histidine kinase VanS
MKHSIRKDFLVIIIGIIALALFVIGVLNYFWLDDFYENNKIKTIKSVYRQLNYSELDYGDSSTESSLSQMSSKYNIQLLVCDNDFTVIYSSAFDREEFGSRLFGYYTGIYRDNVDVIEQNDSYTLQKTYERFHNLNYLEIWGRISDGNYLIIRMPLESIANSVKISNRFFYIVGGIVVILTFFIVLYISDKFTAPIRRLTEISERMAGLDFDAHYESSRFKNEIDIVGEQFNKMSNTLEQTLSELKSANIKLRSDVEEKERIDNMRREFIHNVSHELKTPIAIIQGYAEGLKDGIADDEENRDYYCDTIIDEANKMNHLVRQLLDLNDLESGADMVSISRFNISSLIDNIIKNMSILIEQKGADISTSIHPDLYVWGDEFKIEQVFTNYLNNALNHVEFEKKIEVKTEIIGKKVRVTVFNTGCPIPDYAIDHIWEKFYKADKARTRQYGGSGIGLSIVKIIMENHKQKYGCLNYDNGVAFYFELELSKICN